MERKAVGPVCCVMHVKEPRTLIVKEKGLAPVFLDSRLEHPAGWICARYKSYHYYYYYRPSYFLNVAQVFGPILGRANTLDFLLVLLVLALTSDTTDYCE